MGSLSAVLILYLKLFWEHLVFWTFPTPEEDYYSRLGFLYFELGKFRKGVACLVKSEEAHDRRELSLSKFNWFYLGYCYLNLGDLRSAIQYLEKYLILDSGHYESATVVAGCYAFLNEPENALTAYLKALEKGADSPDLHLECSRILEELGRKDQASMHLKMAEEKLSERIDKEFIRAVAYRANGDLNKAIEILKQIAAHAANGSDNEKSLFQESVEFILFRFLKENGDDQEALIRLESAMVQSPDDPWLMNELAMEYTDQSMKLDEALDLADRILIYQPDNPVFLDTRGWVLYKMGKTKEAEEMILQSLTFDSKNKQTLSHLESIRATLLATSL